MRTATQRTETFRCAPGPSYRSRAHERPGRPVPPSAFGRVRVASGAVGELLPSARKVPGTRLLACDSPVTATTEVLENFGGTPPSGRVRYAYGYPTNGDIPVCPRIFGSRAYERPGLPVPPSAFGRVRVESGRGGELLLPLRTVPSTGSSDRSLGNFRGDSTLR